MFFDLGIPWRSLFQVGGETNWVRAVGSSLVFAALFQGVVTWQMTVQRGVRIDEVAAQWAAIDGASENPPTEAFTVKIISGSRPEAFAGEYDRKIHYGRLWSAAFLILGVALFICGGLIELVGSGSD